MKTALLGFGIVYLAGAVLLVFDITPLLPAKNLSVLAFLLPGAVALIAHLEIEKLKKQLADLREKEKEG